MPSRTSTCLIALCLLALPLSAVAQPTPNFAADWTFEGSSLAGWQAAGEAGWTAADGVITGTPAGGPGWLVLDRSFQDVEMFLRFRCYSVCDAGVLLRRQDAGGAHEGVFVEATDSLSLYRVTLDENGHITRRDRLSGAPGMARIAGGSFNRPSGTADLDGQVWNELTIVLDANIIRTHLNGWGGVSGATGDDAAGYGPPALYVSGSGPVEFSDIAVADYNTRHVAPEETSGRFTLQQLDEFYYAWDTGVADFNQDGTLDVVAGPYIFDGPDFTTRHEIYLGEAFNPSTDFTPNMVTHAADFTGDGWPDVLATESRAMVLYVNPHGESRRWTRHEAIPEIISETTLLRDVDNDGRPEVVHIAGDGLLSYAEPDPSDPTALWPVYHVSEPMGRRNAIHGIGAGDVDGDGLPDLLMPAGWFEQPDMGAKTSAWTFHPFTFTEAGGIEGSGGANMAVVDLNGDGMNDVASSLNAHGWGLAWFEQQRDASGGITFEPHLIMGDPTHDNPDDVAFSELHSGVEIADVDRDGMPDIVTGKRYFAHLDSSTDPDPYSPAVLYWFRTVRDAAAPGGVAFHPELIHNRSGVGSQFEVADLNGDGAVDMVTSGDRGTFIFWGSR